MMRRLSVLTVVGALALMATGGMRGAPARESISFVLWIDATSSVTEAMAQFLWDEPPRRGDAIFKGSKIPATLGDAFKSPVNDGFIQRLPAGDRARIGSIATSLRLSPSFTADRPALRRALGDALNVSREDRYGPTPLWDAIVEGIAALEPESGKRAIVLVTDGMATGNRYGLGDVIEHAKRAGVSVSVLCEAWGSPRSLHWHMTDSTGSTWTMMSGAFGKSPEANLRRLASSTGGVFAADGGGGSVPDPGSRLAAILDALHSRAGSQQ